MRTTAWSTGAAAVVLLAALAGCGDDSTVTADEGPTVDVPVVGRGEVGPYEIVVAAAPPDRILLAWEAFDCEERDGEQETVHAEATWWAVPAVVGPDGSFDAERSVVLPGYDGDEEVVEISVSGALSPDGGASGTFSATSTSLNGQGEALDLPDDGTVVCESVAEEWEAAPADDLSTGRALFAFQAAADDDVAAVQELAADGLDLATTHPFTGESLTASIVAECTDADGFRQSVGGDDGDERTYPSDDAPSTVEALVDLGAPAPVCADD